MFNCKFDEGLAKNLRLVVKRKYCRTARYTGYQLYDTVYNCKFDEGPAKNIRLVVKRKYGPTTM